MGHDFSAPPSNVTAVPVPVVGDVTDVADIADVGGSTVVQPVDVAIATTPQS